MSKPVVVVSRRWPDAVERVLSRRYTVRFNKTDTALTAQDWRQAVAEADAICPTVTDRLDGELIATAGQRLRLIANYGVGYEHIDVTAAKARGIVVTNTPDVLTESTADLEPSIASNQPRNRLPVIDMMRAIERVAPFGRRGDAKGVVDGGGHGFGRLRTGGGVGA